MELLNPDKDSMENWSMVGQKFNRRPISSPRKLIKMNKTQIHWVGLVYLTIQVSKLVEPAPPLMTLVYYATIQRIPFIELIPTFTKW